MYTNSNFDVIIEKINSGVIPSNLTSTQAEVIRNYGIQKNTQGLNPFNIMYLNSLNLSIDIVDEFLSFLYKNSIRSFVFADSSSSALRNLALLSCSSLYRINLVNGTYWKTLYRTEYGLIVEIVRRHK